MRVRLPALTFLLLIFLLRPFPALADDPIQPGEKIGEMEITTGRAGVSALAIYCPDEGACSLPQVERIAVGNGWDAADQALLEDNWSALSWELYIDGRLVDLQSFGTIDADRLRGNISGQSGTVVTKSRFWDVILVNPTPGFHPVRSVLRVSHDIHDGYFTFPAGTYDYDFDFTVEGEQPATVPRTGSAAAATPILLAGLLGLLMLAAGLLLRRGVPAKF